MASDYDRGQGPGNAESDYGRRDYDRRGSTDHTYLRLVQNTGPDFVLTRTL